jgi:uncharacterized protein YkwD
MRILATVLFFSLSFVLFTSCTILILSYPRLTAQIAVKGISTFRTAENKTQNKKLGVSFKQSLSPTPRIVQPTQKVTLVSTEKTSPTSSALVPTDKPSPTLIKSGQTMSPTPTLVFIQSTPTIVPKRSEVVQTGGLFISQINAYRAQNGLGPVSANSETCTFAAIRAQEIASDFSHNGFTNRINSKTLPYSSYHEVTENIAMNSDASQIVTMWINSPGHAENMRKDTPYVCVAQSGNYFAYEGWHP